VQVQARCPEAREHDRQKLAEFALHQVLRVNGYALN
jgi:hypothetical protein